jgi:hypothetical protein
MPRKIDDLEAHAAKFWPTALAQREQTTSIIPKLIESQEKFIGILYVADASPAAWKDVLLATAGMPANLFLKHLVVLSDVGGENLKRYRTEMPKFFPGGRMRFYWRNSEYAYKFRSLKDNGAWSNPELRIDGRGLATGADLSPAMEDAATLLIHAGASIDPGLPDSIPEKCTIGSFVGHKRELDVFVRQRYIHVSQVLRGARANTMGQLCQSYVKEHLKNALPNWRLSRHTIPGISHNAGRTDMSFDLVAQSPSGICCAIEVSFQVTTNGTVERKAGQAGARQKLLHDAGHKIAYVVDGAGNFERRSFLSTICQYSDCTVTFKDDELDVLAAFLKTLE